MFVHTTPADEASTAAGQPFQLTDSHGEILPTTQAALHLNEIVHTLPWQNEVQRALHRVAVAA